MPHTQPNFVSSRHYVDVIVNGAFIAFFAATGQPTFVATTVNIALVSIGMLVILNVNYGDFARRVNAQAKAQRREEAQSRLLRMIDDMPVTAMTVEPDTLNINYANETSKNLIGQISICCRSRPTRFSALPSMFSAPRRDHRGRRRRNGSASEGCTEMKGFFYGRPS